MDVIFGSLGVAQADMERQDEINREIGLDRALANVQDLGTARRTGREKDEVSVGSGEKGEKVWGWAVGEDRENCEID